MNGLVVKNEGGVCGVLCDNGHTVEALVKGSFRLKGIKSTNPVVVGDRVVLEERDNGKAYITEIFDRKNYIVRRSQNLSCQCHIIASNVDQALLIATIARPETSTTFIDRFLASAEAYRIPVIIAFNKIDNLTESERKKHNAMLDLYRKVGYNTLSLSAIYGDGVEELTKLLLGKITVVSGNSGVGKSTLINRIIPNANLRTAEISKAHNTGTHTTTFSKMISLKNSDGFLVDTPGIKGFGMFDMATRELSGYFKDIFSFSKFCRFNSCTHTDEPGCAVKKAVEENEIAESRYRSYISMYEEKKDEKYRPAY